MVVSSSSPMYPGYATLIKRGSACRACGNILDRTSTWYAHHWLMCLGLSSGHPHRASSSKLKSLQNMQPTLDRRGFITFAQIALVLYSYEHEWKTSIGVPPSPGGCPAQPCKVGLVDHGTPDYRDYESLLPNGRTFSYCIAVHSNAHCSFCIAFPSGQDEPCEDVPY